MKNLISLLAAICFCIVSGAATNVKFVVSAKVPGLLEAHRVNDWNRYYSDPQEVYLIKEEGMPSFAYSSARGDYDFFFIPVGTGGKILALFPLQTSSSYLAIAQDNAYFFDIANGITITVPIKPNGHTVTRW